MARRFIRLFIFLVVVGLIAVGGSLGWGYAEFTRPGPSATDQSVVLTKGLGLRRIAETLADRQIVSEPLVFRAGVRLGGWSRQLKAGEYRFPAGTSMRGVVEILRRGVTVVRRVTVPEGLSSSQVVEILRATEGLSGEITQIPGEGSLLPETYHFSYGDERAGLLRRMEDAMQATLTELWPERQQNLPLASPAEALVLASMVEKETSLPEERPRIAGVFVNRLHRGMRLQSDPTVVYGLTGGRAPLGRALRRSDLEGQTAYNTYRIPALPPGPIANPGRAAISAVLQPQATNELYFVADGTGGHAFAATFAEHRRNVRRWRRTQRDRNKQ